MRLFKDYQGRQIRLTDERIAHITVRHPQIFDLEGSFEATLGAPDMVMPSNSDPQARVYYRWFPGTVHGDKWARIVVIIKGDDAFISTAFISSEL